MPLGETWAFLPAPQEPWLSRTVRCQRWDRFLVCSERRAFQLESDASPGWAGH
jgi:hypothetical protein